jgi:hypothetical protein
VQNNAAAEEGKAAALNRDALNNRRRCAAAVPSNARSALGAAKVKDSAIPADFIAKLISTKGLTNQISVGSQRVKRDDGKQDEGNWQGG